MVDCAVHNIYIFSNFFLKFSKIECGWNNHPILAQKVSKKEFLMDIRHS